MTEAEWLACADPGPMLAFLEGKASDRKLRLLACACCRSIWIYLVDDRSKQAVIAAEQYADGALSWSQLEAARDEWVAYYLTETGTYQLLCEAVRYVSSEVLNLAFIFHYTAAAVAFYTKQNSADSRAVKSERAVHAKMFHCIFGSPFRVSPSLPVFVLNWNDSIIPKLARGIYADRAFDRLPILADALEDAGCDNTDILAHCRGPGPHVRGCWVVDLILGKC